VPSQQSAANPRLNEIRLLGQTATVA